MSKEFDISLVTDQQIVDAVEDKLTNYKKGLPREEVFVAAERFVQEMALPNAYRESSIIYK